MTKRDVLDEQSARQFAWRTTAPEAAPAPAEPPRAVQAPLDDAETQERRRQEAEYAAARCAELAAAVARAWEIPSPAGQAAATKELIRLAQRLGFGIVRMDDHPIEAVRLWRLIIRHRERTGRRRHDLFGLGFMPVSARPSEVVDLLVEAAEEGDAHLVYVVGSAVAREETGRRHPELGARLARVVDEGRTWQSRAIAAQWLSLAEFPAAVPALRRALRQPHARLRYCALFILQQMDGPALLEEDVLWLLEDAVKHPLEHGYGGGMERALDYEDALLEAVAKAPPAEGFRPLERIADGGGAHIDRDREGLDAGWALCALAAGYPQRALARIDRAFLSSSSWSWRRAVEAIGRLPAELARPRLLEAAARAQHDVVERAKAIWFDRFGEACPVKPTAGVPLELLSEPLSERFFARMTVLRGASDDARHAMLDVLLAEAPTLAAPPEHLSAAQREALALLLFAVSPGVALYKHPTLPTSEREWAPMLLRRFGAPAFDGLLAIAERAAVAGVDHGWLIELAGLTRDGELRAAQQDRLRDVAGRALTSPMWQGAAAPLIVLSKVGAPAALEDRLSAILAEEAAEVPVAARADAARWAINALVALRDAPGFDARLVAAAAEALKGRAWPLLERLLQVGSARGAAVLDLAEEAIAALDHDPAAVTAARSGSWALDKAGRVDHAWLGERLLRPESRGFGVAAGFVDKAAPPFLIDALRRVVASDARAGAAAAEAAARLVALDAMGKDDPRLEGILERAPTRERADLLWMLLRCGAPLTAYRRQVVEVLLSADESAASSVIDALHMSKPGGTDELFEELLQRELTAGVRAAMEHSLRAPNEAARYWQHVDTDDEEDDDEELDEEEDDDGLD